MISKKFERRFDAPHLYKEDLEEIVAIVKELQPQKFKIEFDNTEYDDLVEIPSRILSIHTFLISTSSPGLEVVISDYRCGVLSNYPTAPVLGICARIVDVIEKRDQGFKSKLKRNSSLIFWVHMALALTNILGLLIVLLSRSNTVLSVFFLVISILALVAMLLNILCLTIAKPLIEFVYKHERPSFLNRKWDDIVIAVISLIIGFIVGQIS